MVRLASIAIAALAATHVARADDLAVPPVPAGPAAASPSVTTPTAASPSTTASSAANAETANRSAANPAVETPSVSPSEPVRGQRSFGIGAEIGFATGLGGALRLGTPRFGVHVAAGVLPLFIFGNEQNAS